MRRYIAYWALPVLSLTLVFAGCRQEPLPESGDPILFSVAREVDAASRTKADTDPPQASVPEDALLKDGSVVKLYGEVTKAGESAVALFEGGTDLTCVETSGVFNWSYAPLKYWGRGSAYDFLAVFPKSEDIDNSSDSNQIVVNYSMEKEVDNQMVRNDYDLLVASSSVDAAPPANNTVSLPFEHACAAVRFQFSDEGLPDDNVPPVYYIKSFELQHLFTEGTFTYDGTAGSWSTEGKYHIPAIYQWTGKWGVRRSLMSIPEREWLFVIPQTLLRDRVNTSVHFTFVSVSAGKEGPEIPVTFNLDTYKGEQVSWKQGKVYSYIIKLQPEQSSISFNVEDWERSFLAVDDMIFNDD